MSEPSSCRRIRPHLQGHGIWIADGGSFRISENKDWSRFNSFEQRRISVTLGQRTLTRRRMTGWLHICWCNEGRKGVEIFHLVHHQHVRRTGLEKEVVIMNRWPSTDGDVERALISHSSSLNGIVRRDEWIDYDERILSSQIPKRYSRATHVCERDDADQWS